MMKTVITLAGAFVGVSAFAMPLSPMETNACQQLAVQASLSEMNLPADAVSIFDLTQTGSAVLIRLTSPQIQTVSNSNHEADITVGVSSFDGDTCQVGQVVVDYYNDNG